MTNKRKCEKMQNSKLVLSVELDAGNNFLLWLLLLAAQMKKNDFIVLYE